MAEESIDTHLPHDDLSALLKVSLALAESLDQDVVLNTAIEAAVDLLGADTGAILLLDGDDAVMGAITSGSVEDLPEGLRRIPRPPG